MKHEPLGTLMTISVGGNNKQRKCSILWNGGRANTMRQKRKRKNNETRKNVFEYGKGKACIVHPLSHNLKSVWLGKVAWHRQQMKHCKPNIIIGFVLKISAHKLHDSNKTRKKKFMAKKRTGQSDNIYIPNGNNEQLPSPVELKPFEKAYTKINWMNHVRMRPQTATGPPEEKGREVPMTKASGSCSHEQRKKKRRRKNVMRKERTDRKNIMK